MLLQDERRANKETRAYGKNDTNCFVYRRSRGVIFTGFGAGSIGSVCPSIQVVGCEEDMVGRIHAVSAGLESHKSMVCCDVGTPYLWRCSRSIKRLVIRRICLVGMYVPLCFVSKFLLFSKYVQQEYDRKSGYVQGVCRRRETEVTCMFMVC